MKHLFQATAAFFILAPLQGALADAIKPMDIPVQYGIGTSATNIDGWIKNNQQDQIRGHGWQIWAGLNADSGQAYNGAPLPIWETWPGSEEVFAKQAPPNAENIKSLARNAPPRSFVSPHQFKHLRLMRGKSAEAITATESMMLVSFNNFSPAAAHYLVKPQVVPG
jgi:hypothetical protein